MNVGKRTEIRRRDRAIEDEAWVGEVLRRAAAGVLATVVDGQPFLHTNLFVYDPDRASIYVHTARQGWTRSTLETDRPACFTVFELGRLLPAARALEFSCEYASVVVYGTGRIVAGRDERRHALQRLLDKYFPDKRPGRDYDGITEDDLKRTTVIRIDIEERIGKRKRVASDFPDARDYESGPLVDLVPGPRPDAEGTD